MNTESTPKTVWRFQPQPSVNLAPVRVKTVTPLLRRERPAQKPAAWVGLTGDEMKTLVANYKNPFNLLLAADIALRKKNAAQKGGGHA
jgi:hypothetical protein